MVALIATILIFFLGMVWPIPQPQVTSLGSQYDNTTRTIQNINSTSTGGVPPALIIWGIIVANNIKLAILDVIPVFGAFVFSISMFSTGRLLQAAVLSGSLSATNTISIGATLFLFPHTILEFSAYALAFSSSVVFIWSLRDKGSRQQALINYFVAIAATVFLVIIAGAFEASLFMSPILSVFLWFPVIYVAFWLRKKYHGNLADAKLQDETLK